MSENFKIFFMHFMSEVKSLDIPFTLTMGQAKLQKRYTAAIERSQPQIIPLYSVFGQF
jgi:hypothetical protein